MVKILDLSINTIDLADGSVTKSKLSSASVDLDKLDPNVCSAGQLIENNGGSWRCTSISSITKRRTENILEWVSNGRVKIRERFGEIMTVKIGSNFYDSPSAALTFNFSNGVGLLGLDNGGTRKASTWYYLYAVPNGSTFSIVASTRSPIAGHLTGPGPLNGYTDYKYLAAFMTDTSSNIQKFVHNYPGEFLFMTRGEDYKNDYGDSPGIGNFTGMQTLTRVPETAKAADVFP